MGSRSTRLADAIFNLLKEFCHRNTTRTSRNQKGISNNEQGTPNIEGRRRFAPYFYYKEPRLRRTILRHSLFDIRYSSFTYSFFSFPSAFFLKNILPENGKTLQQGNLSLLRFQKEYRILNNECRMSKGSRLINFIILLKNDVLPFPGFF